MFSIYDIFQIVVKRFWAFKKYVYIYIYIFWFSKTIFDKNKMS